MPTKISDLPSASSATGAESIPIVQGGVTKKILASILYAASTGSGLVGFIQAGTGAILRTAQSELRDTVSVKQFGAVGDGVTDDLAAFNLAVAAASLLGKALHVPATSAYYKLSDTLTINTQSFSMFGDGTMSCLVIHNATGADCIKVQASHVSIRDIGISGIAGSGNGLHINTTGAVGEGRYSGIWIGWVDGDGLRVTQGQSNIFTEISIDQNSGYRPITLTSGTEGNTNNGFNILGNASGNTNNQSFVNCRSNAGAINGYSLKVGDAGIAAVGSFSWQGGLFQGATNYTEVYLRCTDGVIDGAHLEPPVGATANYVATFDGAQNTVIQNTTIQGDIQIIGGSQRCGMINVRGCGLTVSSDSTRSFWHGGNYRNIITGPTLGVIRDASGQLDIRDTLNVSNSVFASANNITGTDATVFHKSTMEDWFADGATKVPCGFDGSATAKETTIKRSGTYSCKVTPASSLSISAFYITLGPLTHIQGKKVVVEAWVYNTVVAGSAHIVGTLNAGGTYAQASNFLNQWERMIVTFYIDSTASGLQHISFTGLAGNPIYWDSIQVTIEDYASPKQMTLDGTATPFIGQNNSTNGPSVALALTSGTPTITDFRPAIVGVPFTVLFAGATTIQNNAKIKLAGGMNFVGSADDTLTLVYCADEIFREVSRSVN